MKKLVSLALAVLLVLSCLSGLCFAADAEAKWTNGVADAEGTFAEMMKQASASGGTVTLLKDVNHTDEKKSYAASSNSSFTLDLNGHTLTSVTGGVTIANSTKGLTETTVIKNGTMICQKIDVSCHKGALQLKDLNLWTEVQQNIIYNGTDGAFNKDNLIEGCTIMNPMWGAFSYNNTKEDQSAVSFTIRNSTLVNAKPGTNGQAIVRQKAAGSPAIVLAEGVKLLAYTTGKNIISSNLQVSGETLTKAEGEHSVTVAGKTADGLAMWTTPETATKEVTVPTAPAAPAETPTTSGAANISKAKAKWSNGTSEVEGTLAEMVKQASSKGGTVTMLESAEYTGENAAAISSDTSFTLDLNGHTLTAAKGAVSVSSKAEGVTVIKNGTIVSNGQYNLNVKGGALQVLNMTLWSKTNQNINYYVIGNKYNHGNLIENSTLANPVWHCISYNDTKNNQQDVCFTIRNSTLICAKSSTPLGLQTKPEGSTGMFALGEGVKLYTYGKSPASAALTLVGEGLTKQDGTHSATVNGMTYDLLNLWTTPETASVDLTAVIPGEPMAAPEAPAAPAEPATPSAPVEQKPAEQKPAEDKKDAPQSGAPVAVVRPADDGAPVGLIIGIAAAVVVIAAVVVVVLKKKKK